MNKALIAIGMAAFAVTDCVAAESATTKTSTPAKPNILFTQYHVAPTGNDANIGTAANPLKTIQAAADKAQPGDTVTVHAGVYRERVNPPRGGTSDTCRITYQAAAGEKVIITGSEPVKGWEKVSGDTWKITLPNTFFGESNT